ncbi:MAG: hypothetical protein KDD85_10255 [Parvularculaceae bacterium]|nr:hypothetical protein [Parvularculaceae bacterium]
MANWFQLHRSGLQNPAGRARRNDLHGARQSAYKRRNSTVSGVAMTALYMIIGFIVVMAILNIATTGRID